MRAEDTIAFTYRSAQSYEHAQCTQSTMSLQNNKLTHNSMHSWTEQLFLPVFSQTFQTKRMTHETIPWLKVKACMCHSNAQVLSLSHSFGSTFGCQWVEVPTASRMRVRMFNDFFLCCRQCDCLQIHSNRKCEKWTLRFRFSKIDATVRDGCCPTTVAALGFRICFYTKI